MLQLYVMLLIVSTPDLFYIKGALAGPTHFGPTAEAATPWLALALYLALRAGPPSVVLVAGQRLWRLPPQLAACTHALLWPWDLDALRAQARPLVSCRNIATLNKKT